MKKILILATFASVIELPAFAQSFDPDLGTGNTVPLVANMGAASAYAQAPANYEREYVQHRHTYRFRTPRTIDRDNTSVPGQGVDKDDTTPKSRQSAAVRQEEPQAAAALFMNGARFGS